MIKKLANISITFNNSSDVMMTSFMTKHGTGSIRQVGLAILAILLKTLPWCPSFLLKFFLAKERASGEAVTTSSSGTRVSKP